LFLLNINTILNQTEEKKGSFLYKLITKVILMKKIFSVSLFSSFLMIFSSAFAMQWQVEGPILNNSGGIVYTHTTYPKNIVSLPKVIGIGKMPYFDIYTNNQMLNTTKPIFTISNRKSDKSCYVVFIQEKRLSKPQLSVLKTSSPGFCTVMAKPNVGLIINP
jgi:hypothetical protein